MKTLLIPLLFLFSPAAFADEDADTPATLTVKPLLCIVDQRTPSCDLHFEIAWRTDLPGYHCLNNDLEDAPLRCWPDARTGEHQDERTVGETFSYWLARDDEQTVLATATVEVLKKDSDDRRRRRRTRYVWDLL